MASKWTDEQKKFLDHTFTLKGRVLFPNLLVARAKEAGKRETYDGQFTWIPQENGAMMNTIMQWLAQANHMFHAGCNPAALVNPIKDFNTYQRQDAKANPDYLRGTLWVNASTGKEYPPQVMRQIPNMPAGQNLLKLTANDEAEVYSGRNVVFNISFYPMIPVAGSTNQKRGFSVNINAVLLQEGGDKVGGAAAVDPAQVFGAFAQDMGMAPSFGAPAAFNPNAAQAPAPGQAPQWGAPAAPAAAPQWGQPAPAPAQAPQWGAPAQAPSFAPGQAPAPTPNNWPPANGAPNGAPAQAPQWGQPAPAPAQAPQWGQQQQQQQAPQWGAPNTNPAFPNGNGNY